MLQVPPKLLLTLLLSPPQLPPAETGAAAAAAAAAMLLQLPPTLLLRLLLRPAATAAAAVTSSQFSADLLLPIDVRLPPTLPPAFYTYRPQGMHSSTSHPVAIAMSRGIFSNMHSYVLCSDQQMCDMQHTAHPSNNSKHSRQQLTIVLIQCCRSVHVSNAHLACLTPLQNPSWMPMGCQQEARGCHN
jgi:hypothetical protein